MHYPTAAIGALAAVAAVILATIGRMKWPLLVAALTQTAAAGLLYGTVGSSLHKGATKLDRVAGEFVGRWTGTIVTGLLAFTIIAVWFVLVVYQRTVNNKTLLLTAATPLFANLIPGMVGALTMYVVGAAPMLVGGALSFAFFGHWS